jgi:Fe(3+) dicitrate transport protein
VKTNVGNSLSKGIEAVVDLDVVKKINKNSLWSLPLYISYSLTDATYGNYFISTKNAQGSYDSLNLRGNSIENAPRNILRAGFGFQRSGKSNPHRKFITQIQFSHVSKTYSDANNTVSPSNNGSNGLIPAYQIWDWNSTFTLNKQVQLKLSVNNLANAHYFTRRSGGYPGPGLLPSDGRSVLCSIGITL